jgi:hypothetical protein
MFYYIFLFFLFISLSFSSRTNFLEFVQKYSLKPANDSAKICEQKLHDNYNLFNNLCEFPDFEETSPVDVKCCETWLNIDCVIQHISPVCDTQGTNEYKSYLDSVVVSLGANLCLNYTYGSSQCNSFVRIIDSDSLVTEIPSWDATL